MRASISILCLTLVCSCGQPDPTELGSEQANVRAIVSNRGDQVHPQLDGHWLVWFDLEPDPNGACFVTDNDPQGESDQSCEGLIRSQNLLTGERYTLSEILFAETRPAIAGNTVAWYCNQGGTHGLCVTPVNSRQVRFYPSKDYWYGSTTRPKLATRMLLWVEYQSGTPSDDYWEGYTLQGLDLDSAQTQTVARLERYPNEWVAFGQQLVWSHSRWEENEYRFELFQFDRAHGELSKLVADKVTIYGLGGANDLLAWKQGQPDYGADNDDSGGVQVQYLDSQGEIQRANSEQARVSTETPVAVGDKLLAWLDYREGDYRIAAFDLRSGKEALVSPPEAIINAYMSPTCSGDRIVWADRRQGDYDLYLFAL